LLWNEDKFKTWRTSPTICLNLLGTFLKTKNQPSERSQDKI